MSEPDNKKSVKPKSMSEILQGVAKQNESSKTVDEIINKGENKTKGTETPIIKASSIPSQNSKLNNISKPIKSTPPESFEHTTYFDKIDWELSGDRESLGLPVEIHQLLDTLRLASKNKYGTKPTKIQLLTNILLHWNKKYIVEKRNYQR